MSSLYGKIIERFAELIERCGFVPAKSVSGNYFVSLVKQISKNICLYLFIKDERSGNGDLNIYLWIAPKDLPDEGIDNLGVGYKILIGASYEPDNSFYEACVLRVKNLLDNIEGIADVVRHEIKKPAFKTYRLKAYRYELSIFKKFLKYSKHDNSKEMKAFHKNAKKIVDGKGSLEKFEKQGAKIALNLLKNQCLSDEEIDFFENDEQIIGDCIADHLYVTTLLEE